MLPYLLIAAAAGLASGLLHLGIGLPALGGLMLAYLAPLPLFLAGLGLGYQGAATAAAVGAVLVALVQGLPFAAIHAVTYGLPVCILCRQALLSRVDDGVSHWYPPGRLSLVLAGLATAFFFLWFLGMALFGDGLLPLLYEIMGQMAAQFADPGQREALLSLAELLPAFGAISWMLGLVVNGVLAQGLLVRFERNLRPSPNLADMELPPALFLVLLGGIVVAMLGGLLGMIGKTLAAIAVVPYFLLGLGVFHAFSRGWNGCLFILMLFYGFVLPLFFVPAAVVIVGLGLLYAAMRLRAGGKPNGGAGTGGDAGKEE